jgi:SAM-dependent methyltransferase
VGRPSPEAASLTEPWVCPACGGVLAAASNDLGCLGCGRRFPILFGIPDLRLQPDRYLDLEADRRRAGNLDAAARRGARFEDLLALYWRETPGTPPRIARQHASGVLASVEESAPLVRSLPPGRLLDVGCGAGGALVVAARESRFSRVVGIDATMRWLVMARQRLRETARPEILELAAASIEAPPFPPRSFDSLVLRHLLEHVRDLRQALRCSAALLSPSGRIALEVFQRWSLLPEPHTGLLGATWLPRRWQPAYVRWRSGDDYSAVRVPSRREVFRAVKESGLRVSEFLSLPLAPSQRDRLPAALRPGAALYEVLRRSRRLDRVLLQRIGPLLRLSMVKEDA